MTRIYSYTLKLSAFLLRGRGGARFRDRWMILNYSIFSSTDTKLQDIQLKSRENFLSDGITCHFVSVGEKML